LLSLGNEVLAMKLGLENIRKLLDALDRPQDKYTKVQVAGTNGKGSVCAFANSICVAAGIRVGMFTSPHLISITERVQINGVEISEDDFARLATRVRETSEKLVESGELENIPTYFEQVTAIALLAFAEAKVELAILETGLGGRLDATTAADAEIVAITRIDLDHQRYLGETIEEIAAEKAAIIQRDSQRVVIGHQLPQALEIILARAKQVGTEYLDPPPSQHWTAEVTHSGELKIVPGGRLGQHIKLGLLGKHQGENAEIAVKLIWLLHRDYGFRVLDEHVLAGLATARHPGRLERIDRFLLDGAHNPGGARALREFLDEEVDQPITMIFGAMNDKNVAEIAAILFPRADWIILTQPENSRAMPVTELRRHIPREIEHVVVTNTSAEALEKAAEVSGDNDLILVTGSLYLIGEVKRALQI